MATSFKLHLSWQNCIRAGRQPPPLVILLPWVWADTKYIAKYAEVACRKQWDVVTARWPMQAMWFPVWAHHLALSLVEAVGSELLANGERPVAFWAFSGSAKGLFSSVLSILAGQQSLSPQQTSAAAAVLRCCCGVIYDSCPVDFTSETGRKLLAPSYSNSNSIQPSASSSSHRVKHRVKSSGSNTGGSGHAAGAIAAVRRAGDVAAGWTVDLGAGVLNFFLLEWFDRDRGNMWQALENPPVHGPFLFLYSRSDELADANQISRLASTLRQRGHSVVEQVWHDTPHCGHLRHHPQQYEESVNYFLAQALQHWSDTWCRIQEGRNIVARWDDDRQQQQHSSAAEATHQQQQQQLIRQPARGILGSPTAGQAGQAHQHQQHTHGCSGSQATNCCQPDPCEIGTHGTGRSSQQSCKASTTGCCCSNSSLAAATAAAVAGATHLAPRNSSKDVSHTRKRQQQQQQQQQHSQRGPTHGGRSRLARTTGHWSSAALAAAALQDGVAGAVSISTCCSCRASECRCAETLAAASGEVVCSDSTTLSHSLRCMASSYLEWQQEQQRGRVQQQKYPAQQQQACVGQPLQQQQQNSILNLHTPAQASLQLHETSSSSAEADVSTDEVILRRVWLRQQRDQHQHLMQRVVHRLRSRL